MEIKKVDLTTINNGAAVELFNEEFGKVLRNINDVSVDAEVPREIKLTFKITPTHDRLSAAIVIYSQAKLASVSKHSGSMFLSQKAGNMEAFVANPNQMNIDFNQPIQETK